MNPGAFLYYDDNCFDCEHHVRGLAGGREDLPSPPECTFIGQAFLSMDLPDDLYYIIENMAFSLSRLGHCPFKKYRVLP